MEENKKISVTIQGNKYIVKGNNSEKYLNMIANQVDTIMNELKKANTLMNNNMVSILCSLNLANQLYIAQEEIAKLEDNLFEAEKIPELINELEKTQDKSMFHLEKYKEAQRNLNDANLELEKYYEIVESYKNKLKQNKIEIDAARQTIADLQNQIFDNQVEIVKMKKELDNEYRNKDTILKNNHISSIRNKKSNKA